jgi:maltokinase
VAEALATIDETALGEWLTTRRWFGSKSQSVSGVHVLDVVPLREEPRPLACALVEARFHAGTHDLYQFVVTVSDEAPEDDVIARLDGQVLHDALGDPHESAVIARLMMESASVESAAGCVRFRWTGAVPPPGEPKNVRAMGAEQSNSSIVFDEALVLKVFRRLLPGENPELEMLRFLSEHGFENIAALAGWYDFTGERMEATLGVLQRFVADGRDGWDVALDAVAGGDAEAFHPRLHELGRVTGDMHTVLGSSSTDPRFAPEEPSAEGLSLLTATIDEEIERVFVDLPDDPAVEPIAGRGEEIRDRLRLLSHASAGGRLIRTHGDYHLGQTLLDDAWVILDFEGEPARSLPERRRKRSPLRDVAGMLRSFSYVASAARILRGSEAPAGWEARAREEFLAGYLETVDPALLPAGEAATRKLLSIFELEKAVYELRYELNNRPEWVGIPVAGILRLLEEEPVE